MANTNRADSLRQLEAKSHALLKSETPLAKSQALCWVQIQATMIKIIKTDVKVGLTFAGIALHTSDETRRQRNKTRARVAYDSVMRYSKSLPFSDEDKTEIRSRQAELRAALEQLGDTL